MVKGSVYGHLTAIKKVESKVLGRKRPRTYETWLFQCSCGITKEIAIKQVLAGNTKACGHLVQTNHYSLPKGEASFRTLVYTYKSNASKRGISFDLSIEDFRILTTLPCYFCGIKPSTVYRRPGFNGDYIYNGIDRLDNTKGYISSNVVSCCETCNRAKLQMPVDVFIAWIEQVYNYTRKIK